jgi:co-chaperonin GroES (HSP10)
MLQPLTNNILIRPEKAPEQTESGLHLVEHCHTGGRPVPLV